MRTKVQESTDKENEETIRWFFRIQGFINKVNKHCPLAVETQAVLFLENEDGNGGTLRPCPLDIFEIMATVGKPGCVRLVGAIVLNADRSVMGIPVINDPEHVEMLRAVTRVRGSQLPSTEATETQVQ